MAADLSAADIAAARAMLIHEDAHILAFGKPSGLAVQGGSGVSRSLEDLLGVFAKSNGKRPRLVHRLDRETSGIILAARTKPAAAFLSAAFAEREVEKTYLALTCGGAPTPAAGEIDAALIRQPGAVDLMRLARPEETGALSACTAYRTIAGQEAAALLELRPHTGRMHQIRVHLASIGRPIAADGKYGGLFSLGGVSAPRLMLHAAALEFPHPAGGRRALSSETPGDFLETLAALGLSLI